MTVRGDTRRDCTAVPDATTLDCIAERAGVHHALQVSEDRPAPSLCRHRHQHGSFAIAADEADERLARLRRRARRSEGKEATSRLRLQGLPLGDPEARQEHEGEHLAPSGAELRLGRLHREARPQVRVRVPSAARARRRSSIARPSRSRSACGPNRCSATSSTTSSSTAASPAARPTRASSATRSPTSSRAPSRPQAREWLSRELDDAILKFIADAEKGDTLLCCFYEFRYEPVAEALKAAVDRGVDVRLIVDAKENEPTTRRASCTRAFPRETISR